MKKIFLFISMCFVFSAGFSATEKVSSEDSEIVAFMITLNKNEIAAAELTKKKQVNKEVKQFADLMIKEHGKNLNAIEQLSKKQKIDPAETAMVASLKAEGKEGINTLTPLIDNAYETAYINAMVKGHSNALASINSFMKEVKNPKLKAYLKATRTHVQHHLAIAEKVQKELNN